VIACLLPYAALLGALVVGGVVSPIPEEAALASAGVALQHGVLSPLPTLVFAIAGVVAGDLAFFALGRGARLFARVRPPSAKMRERALSLFERWGDGAIVVARFVPGLRSAVFFVAGVMGASTRRVLVIDLAAASVHVPLLLAVGVLVSR
jgi:membrane-associated protein